MMTPCRSAFAALALLMLATPGRTQAIAEDAPILRLDCGGIGLEESERMRAEVGMHALTVFFSTTEGGWVTDVETQVDEPLSGLRAEASCGPIGRSTCPRRGATASPRPTPASVRSTGSISRPRAAPACRYAGRSERDRPGAHAP